MNQLINNETNPNEDPVNAAALDKDQQWLQQQSGANDFQNYDSEQCTTI